MIEHLDDYSEDVAFAWAEGPDDPNDTYDVANWESMDEDVEFCDSVDPVEGYECIREAGHPGPHQSHICNGTCDNCDCVEWDGAA